MAGSRYVPITLAEMDKLMVDECGFTRVQKAGYKEWSYERQVSFKEGSKRAPASGLVLPMKVVVDSSVHVDTAMTRDNGEDAIHVRLFNLATAGFSRHYPDGFPISKTDFPEANKTHYRTKSALDNLYKTCRGMFDLAARISCPKCGAPLRPRTSGRGDFYGCSTYPTCNGTKRVEEVWPPTA